MPDLDQEERGKRARIILRAIMQAGGSASSTEIRERVNRNKYQLSVTQIRWMLYRMEAQRLVASTPSGRGITVVWTVTAAGRKYASK